MADDKWDLEAEKKEKFRDEKVGERRQAGNTSEVCKV